MGRTSNDKNTLDQIYKVNDVPQILYEKYENSELIHDNYRDIKSLRNNMLKNLDDTLKKAQNETLWRVH